MRDAALRALLASSGYEIRFREHGWVECLLVQAEEAWCGRGRDHSEALSAAVRLACPSGLARHLLERALDEPSPAEVNLASPRPLPEVRATELPLAASEAGEGYREEVEVRVPLAPARTVAPKIRPGPPPLVRREPPPARPDVQRALEDLELLTERIRDCREELGLCAPERQRLAILAWICEARAHTDTFPESARVREEVAVISRQLTEIGKAFWPGSVTALQLHMQPKDLPKHLLGGCASTWSRAAELAERVLAGVEYADERRGLDEYGWADARLLEPCPEAPVVELARLLAEVEAVAGPLDRQAEPSQPERLPDPRAYLGWVRRLRWLRGTGVDPDRWGRLAGRLRWWAGRRDAEIAAAARELEPGHAPRRPWAEELGMRGVSRDHCPSVLGAEVEGAIQQALAGQRILFVSNRRDSEELARLSAGLGGVAIEWRSAEPRRIAEVAGQIEEGAFDVAFSALGFQAPSTDQLLARACRRASAAYHRVNRGAPEVCLRVVARALGRSVR